MKKSRTKSKLFKYFKGRLIQITVKDVKSVNRNKRLANTSFVGFLVDEDESNFYLSQGDKKEIFAAIPKSQNAGIELISEVDLLLSEIDIPDDQEVQ